ncbi:hypothetical protein MKUB_21540 [Mycobacterium kubicae]|uniref:Uncharacterized protein n=1 Tax=Mycobacterium kubicae TaxID=120959 RepID=A0AAX1JHI9_9MYCO|nr:hypothetical protein [Mycobacterium kubicae]MCV7095520.1 hypothetical protein [Mycobacterium kubicae]ORV94165.1 hypothetical protein AWC13_23290 [Mycobacterium kubicae]QNI11764.1 hypothetical protein GAN18_11545 [Mycobacterium kubicae]QPI39986.1 hypothetical protein I2456_11400 [Mycobacterium kubicae]GFG64664.1 hypothetical protein MKUB_21540 [Mycobacterium kubicae]
MTAWEVIAFDLTDDERMLMLHGLNEYLNSATRAEPLLGPILGVAGSDEFNTLVQRLYDAIREQAPMSKLDWTRALFLTEVSWASELAGAGSILAAKVPDEVATALLRSIQREVMFLGRYQMLQDNATSVGRTKWSLPLVGSSTPSTQPNSRVTPTGRAVAIDLTDDERLLIVHGLNEYRGSAKRAMPLLTPLVGLSNTEEFRGFLSRLIDGVKRKEPLSDLDWAQAVFLTEIGWASDVVGSGIDFATNIRDEKAAPLLRSIQRKVVTPERSALFRDSAYRVAE